jgi:hypothetical protein
MVMLPPQNSLSHSVPTPLADGETANYLVPWPEYERVNGSMIREHFAGLRGRFRARLLRVGVETSAGGTFTRRIERPLSRRFVKVAREKR